MPLAKGRSSTQVLYRVGCRHGAGLGQILNSERDACSLKGEMVIYPAADKSHVLHSALTKAQGFFFVVTVFSVPHVPTRCVQSRLVPFPILRLFIPTPVTRYESQPKWQQLPLVDEWRFPWKPSIVRARVSFVAQITTTGKQLGALDIYDTTKMKSRLSCDIHAGTPSIGPIGLRTKAPS